VSSNRLGILLIVLAALTLGAFIAVAGDGERRIELSEVPDKVMEAAKQAVEGILLTAAEVEIERGVTIYELLGTAHGKRYEIEVTEDGRVIEVESEDHDDDDDDHDDDD